MLPELERTYFQSFSAPIKRSNTPKKRLVVARLGNVLDIANFRNINFQWNLQSSPNKI